MYARRQGIYTGYNEVNAKGPTILDCHIGCIGIKGGYPKIKSFVSWQEVTNWDIHSPYPSNPLLEKTPYDFRLKAHVIILSLTVVRRKKLVIPCE